MRVRVRFFAQLREAAGTERTEMEVPAGISARHLAHLVGEKFVGLGPVLARAGIAVNGEWTDEEIQLVAGDEVSFLPPVSGG